MDGLLTPSSPALAEQRAVEQRLHALELTRRVYSQYVMKFGPAPGSAAYFGSFSGRSTSSASFVTLWQTYLPTVPYPAIAFASYCLAAVGDSAEVRLVVTDGLGSSTSPVGSISGNALYQFIGIDWLHSRELWRGAATVELQARRSGGSSADITIAPIESTLRDPAQALVTPGWTVA